MARSPLTRPVVLVGMMGSGKSAVGAALAAQLGVAFRDSDEEIELAAKASISEIFARDGEAFFRARESEVLRRLLEAGPCVLSTGGGAWMSAANREMIEARGVSVWLEADLELLWSRVRGRSTRPLLQGDDPKGTLTQIFEARQATYAQAALRVPAEPGLSVTGMAGKVVAALRAHGLLEMAE